MNQKASLQIEMPGVDFVGMAREAIAAKLTESLAGSDEAITRIVVAAMATKVNEHGVVGSYSNNIPFIEWIAHDLLRSAAKKVLAERVEALRPSIEAAIDKHLAKSTKSIAAALATGFVETAKNGYGIDIRLTVGVHGTEAA